MLIRYLSSTLKEQNIDQNYFYIFFSQRSIFFQFKIWDTNRTHVLNLKKNGKKIQIKNRDFFYMRKFWKQDLDPGYNSVAKLFGSNLEKTVSPSHYQEYWIIQDHSQYFNYVTIFIDWKSDLSTYYDWSMNEKNVFHNE